MSNDKVIEAVKAVGGSHGNWFESNGTQRKDIVFKDANQLLAFHRKLCEMESEPVAWMKDDGSVCSLTFKEGHPNEGFANLYSIPLYLSLQPSTQDTEYVKRLEDALRALKSEVTHELNVSFIKDIDAVLASKPKGE